MMRIFAICCLFLSSLALAQDGLGRLFTTPAERANLDYLRSTTKDVSIKEKQDSVSAPPAEMVEEPVAQPSARISMQGFVKRSDGKKGTVWINHQPILENTRQDNLSVGKLARDKNEVEIGLKSGQHFALKAGQVYEITSNKRQEIAKPAKN
ncbi:MAG TPA: hypothetical protein VGJ90_12135 [Methylophilaceae bacterium]|jgi:hypothetical protein